MRVERSSWEIGNFAKNCLFLTHHNADAEATTIGHVLMYGCTNLGSDFLPEARELLPESGCA